MVLARTALLSAVLVLLSVRPTLGATPESGKLVFLGNRNIAPVVYLDGTRPAGVAVDIVRALERHMPKPVEIRAMDWPEAQALVASGRADALVQINPTEQRRKILDFSDELLESQFSIFTNTDHLGISGISGLRGLRVGVEAGGLPYQLLEKNPHIRLTTIPDFLTGFRQLNEGALDAVVVDYRVGAYVIAKNRLRDIRVAGEPIAFSYSAIAVRKGNAPLLAAINSALRTIRADGTYQQVLDRWTPVEVVFRTREQIERETLLVAVAVMLILSVIAVLWTLTLRRELRKRRSTEAQLRSSEQLFRALIENSPDLIARFDRELRPRYVNPAVEKAFGLTADAIVGNPLRALPGSADAELAGAIEALIRRAFAEGVANAAELGLEMPAGRCHFEMRHIPEKDAAGHVTSVLSIGHDITHRKRAEAQIRELNLELERHVVERTAQLEATGRELETFAYSVSHDLRQPLRAIDGYRGMLEKHLGTSLDDQGRHYLKSISAAATRMGLLIDDLLSFSHMGRFELTKRPVALDSLVRQAIEQLSGETAGRNVHWHIADLPEVACDHAMLHRVFVNLVSNALKFTRTRPVAEIEIGSRDEKHEIVVFVRDNGAGFDMKYADKLFGVFQRLHSVTEFEGTGIGLANVRRIIQRHGGRTWAEGEVGKGATFYFSLPHSTPEETVHENSDIR